MEIDNGAGGKLKIEVERESPDAIYISEMTLGGKPLKNYRITHDQLMKGGELKFKLTNKPKK